MSWFSAMQDWTEATFGNLGLGWSLLALLCLAFAESSFFPIPPDILVIDFVLRWPSWFLVIAAVATAGSVLGGIAGYWIGERGGRPLLKRMFKPEKLMAAEAYFEKWGAWAVGIAGFSPIPYKIFTITAGALRLDRKRFIIASSISRGARFFLEATILFIYGDELQDFIDSKYFNAATLIGVAGLIAVLWLRSKLAEKKRAEIDVPSLSVETTDQIDEGDRESGDEEGGAREDGEREGSEDTAPDENAKQHGDSSDPDLVVGDDGEPG